MRVLAIGSHPDDVELGCGATLAKHAMAGDEVYILVMGSGLTARYNELPEVGYQERGLSPEAQRAGAILGAKEVKVLAFPDNAMDTQPLLSVVRAIEMEIERIRPDVVYTHSSADLNIDHTITHRAVLTACRPIPGQCVKRILAFEVASSTEYGTRLFAPTVFEDATGNPFDLKLVALDQYPSEMRTWPHPRCCHSLSVLGSARGISVGLAIAEAFELVREVR